MVRALVYSLSAIALFLCSCSGAGSVANKADYTNGGISRIRYLELRVAAEEKLNCEKAKITYKYLGEKAHLLKGCGREIRYLVFSYNDTWVEIESFHKRAAFELDCSIEELQIEYIEEMRWRVFGCGRLAAYVLFCSNNNQECEWFRSDDILR